MKENDTTDLDLEDIIEDVDQVDLIEAKKSCKEEDDDCDDDDKEDEDEDEDDLDEAKKQKKEAVVDGKDDDDKEDDGEGTDGVGDEDGDVDNDGDSDKSDDYLTKRRQAIDKKKNESVDEDDDDYLDEGVEGESKFHVSYDAGGKTGHTWKYFDDKNKAEKFAREHHSVVGNMLSKTDHAAVLKKGKALLKQHHPGVSVDVEHEINGHKTKSTVTKFAGMTRGETLRVHDYLSAGNHTLSKKLAAGDRSDVENHEKSEAHKPYVSTSGKDQAFASKDYKKAHMKLYKKTTNESIDYATDLNSLVEDDQTLSEDFKEKAGIIFEAALTSRLREETETLQEDFDNRLVEETEKIKETLSEKIDNYLTYAVESWVEDNKIALESGLRTEVAENFIDALKNVFVEHYIEVPDTKKNLVAELENKLTIAEQALSATEEKANDLNEQVEKLTRETVIAEATESLADTQAARLIGLVQDVEFVNEETFRKKVLTIKECYFKNKPETVIEKDDTSSYTKTEVIVEDNIENEISPSMQKYVNALNRINKSNTISGGR